MATTKKAAKKGCTPISVEVAILTPDDKHQINFGLTKGCNPDDTVFWIIDFLLKEQKGSKMVTRVEVHVHVGKEKQQDVEKLAKTKKLSDEAIDLLNTLAAERAKKLPPGTTNDPELNKLVSAAISS
jgi:hypothetical protein